MSNDLIYLSLSEMREGLRKRSFSSRELVEAHIKRVEEVSPLNAYITKTSDKAIHQADQSDARLSSGEAGLLEGIPLAIKDLFCTKDIRTTAASRILSDFIPPYESTVTQNLFDQGMVCIGKTNLDEFAMGSANLTSAFGPTLSPWKNADGEFTVPGGSSGGSAAAVASFSAPAALGTDTGGSIRQPASFSGLVGLKPTYGRCSRYGTVAFASSLDQAGPLTRTVEDAALILQEMAGFDPKDSTSSDVPVPDYFRALQGQIKGLKIGLPKEYRLPGLRLDIEALWEKSAQWLRDQGAEVKEISLPHTQYGLPVYYILAPAEASSNLSRYDGVRYGTRVEGQTLDELYEKSRGAGFGSEVKRRILIGTFVLSAGHYDAYFIRAQKVRTRIIEDFHKAFQEVDVILCPSTPTPAFTVGQEPTDEITMYMNDVFTVISNLAGLPAISVPVGMSSDGLPLGMQLIGKAFDESTLFCVAQKLMEATDINPIELLKGANA